MDFKAFITAFNTLKNSFPKKPNYTVRSENSPYGDYIIDCKNVYYGFDTVQCEDGFYLYDCFMSRNCANSYLVVRSELCYEGVDLYQCYNGSYLLSCALCTDCDYCISCTNCQNCFGCVDLWSKQYCFFNEQLEKEEYEKRVKEFKSTHKPEDIMAKIRAMELTLPNTAKEDNNEKSSALYYSYFNKNVYYVSDATQNEDSAYLFDSHRLKECFDTSYSADNEDCYDVVDTIKSSGCFSSKDLVKCIDCFFSYDLLNCSDCIGCSHLSSKQYCILNRQYTKDEYEKLKGQILGSFDPKLLT